ncbi:hypothetical protein ASPWEDRAFT_33439 [Aspergillus wentii DTO 134E9]|uniref:Uncharacterized protein n=1 Tax=Aspergillus wentii DTO 134E9 TaxID=1073089 RepID=A0A1L9RYW2_ASPWE|nr:uncharacterized protein ASPWEDRAFT_33439 [Aspergillus wentii DTO 134E9]KAI9932540.1 hypothetical protein MW887_008782 [Aspergillus wentii]OJJ40105.1 hypothetical protein ASPWEDRAFT_33439 [Aspergillus wentii DTO 134E9]
MAGQYILYDLAGQKPGTWSMNPWKAKLVLAFKGIDYRTEWIEYPDIKPILEKHLPPNTDGFAYSVPTIIAPDGTYVMDSRKIADYIEAQQPEPSLHLDSPYLEKVEALWTRYMMGLVPLLLPQVPKRLLNDASHEHWYTTREKMVGMSLDQLEQVADAKKAWEEAGSAVAEITALLKENEGPFFLGSTASYADFVWVGMLLFAQKLGEEYIKETLERSGDRQVHLDLLAAVKPWVGE